SPMFPRYLCSMTSAYDRPGCSGTPGGSLAGTPGPAGTPGLAGTPGQERAPRATAARDSEFEEPAGVARGRRRGSVLRDVAAQRVCECRGVARAQMASQRFVFGDDLLAAFEQTVSDREQGEAVTVGQLRVHLEHHPVVAGLDETAVEGQGEVDESGDVALGEGGALLVDRDLEALGQASAQLVGGTVDRGRLEDVADIGQLDDRAFVDALDDGPALGVDEDPPLVLQSGQSHAPRGATDLGLRGQSRLAEHGPRSVDAAEDLTADDPVGPFGRAQRLLLLTHRCSSPLIPVSRIARSPSPDRSAVVVSCSFVIAARARVRPGQCR